MRAHPLVDTGRLGHARCGKVAGKEVISVIPRRAFLAAGLAGTLGLAACGPSSAATVPPAAHHASAHRALRANALVTPPARIDGFATTGSGWTAAGLQWAIAASAISWAPLSVTLAGQSGTVAWRPETVRMSSESAATTTGPTTFTSITWTAALAAAPPVSLLTQSAWTVPQQSLVVAAIDHAVIHQTDVLDAAVHTPATLIVYLRVTQPVDPYQVPPLESMKDGFAPPLLAWDTSPMMTPVQPLTSVGLSGYPYIWFSDVLIH